MACLRSQSWQLMETEIGHLVDGFLDKGLSMWLPASLPTPSPLPDLASQQRRGAWATPPRGRRGCALLGRFSRVQLFATPQTVARQAPLSTGFSRQDY